MIKSNIKLQQFITESLIAISTGLNEATESLREKDQHIKGFGIPVYSQKQRCVEFDIAVTVGHEVSGEAEGNATLVVADFGGSAEGKYASERVSRIKFYARALDREL
jgi:hypothetical protein